MLSPRDAQSVSTNSSRANVPKAATKSSRAGITGRPPKGQVALLHRPTTARPGGRGREGDGRSGVPPWPRFYHHAPPERGAQSAGGGGGRGCPLAPLLSVGTRCGRDARRCTVSKDSKGFKEGRDSRNGQFITIREAKSRPSSTSVEIVPKKGHGDSGRYPKK